MTSRDDTQNEVGGAGAAEPDATGARLTSGLAQASTGMIFLTADGIVDFANPAFEAALGAGDLAGRALSLVAPDLIGPDGAPRGDRTPAIAWSKLECGGFFGVMEAVRRVEPEDDRLERDPLTGFLNARGLGAALGAMFGADGRNGLDVAALYVDLDSFKRAADSVGFDGTETLLRRVAGRIRSIVRSDDLVARIGDDEFVLAVRSATGREGPTEIGLRLSEVLARPFLVNGKQIMIGASVGLALRSDGAPTGGELVRFGKIAMEHGRMSGRGKITWFESAMGEAIRERQFIETGLRRAILLDEFEVFYQPQFAFAQNTITGFEALIRWRHPERGLISPVAFIPIAEEMSLLPAIGAWVLEAACVEAAGWPAEMTIAVNVSPTQFEAKNFVSIVEGALGRSGLDPKRLELELTEAGLLRDEADTVGRMKALRALGVRLALDDFGTGYASLNYLRQFPFDKIKMDQSFVRGPTADADAMRIVQAVASLGKSLGMSVLAEGVETGAQLEDIRMRGCDSVQGYLFSMPMPAPQVAAFIAKFSTAAGPTGHQ